MVSRRHRWNVTLPARIPPRADRGQIATEKVTKSSTTRLIATEAESVAKSGETTDAAECDQGEFRNAAKSGGHNIFPTGPEVVVRPARPPSLDCPNIDHLAVSLSLLVSYCLDASLVNG
jgi:hypothetical protein